MSEFSQYPYQQMAQQQAYRQYQNYSQLPGRQYSWTQGWFAYNDREYIKGFVVGAGLTFLLTNPAVQKAMVKGAVTLWTALQGGFEEVKEQIQDIKSEMSMK